MSRDAANKAFGEAAIRAAVEIFSGPREPARFIFDASQWYELYEGEYREDCTAKKPMARAR
jgi:hypothetical protein